MTSTLLQPGPYDALGKARPDEPIFPLLARDPVAPKCVEAWSDLTRKDVMARLADYGPDDTVPDDLREKLLQCSEADMVAWEMRRWRKGEGDQAAIPLRATYSGGAVDSAAMDEAERKAAHARGLSELREAAFYTNEGTERLTKLGELEPADTIDLAAALATINRIADAHTPRRPNFAVQTALELPEPDLDTRNIDPVLT